MRIFLVEDEVIALQSLRQKIEDIGGNWEIVGAAENGAEALRTIPASHPDVVLTDIRMPDMDGLTLVEQLKERGSRVLPIIVSGYQDFTYAQQAVRLGVKDYLLKPVDPAELAVCLEQCRSRLKKQRSCDNMISFLVDEDPISIEFSAGETRFAVAYLIIANVLNDLEHVQHPGIPCVSSAEIESVFAPCFPVGISIRCINGFFSNEKAVVFNGSGLDEAELQGRLESAAKALRTRVGQAVTVYYRGVNAPEKLESAARACRKGAQEAAIFGENVITSRSEAAHVPDGTLSDQARLFTMLLRQNQTKALYKNVISLFADWRRTRRRGQEISADLVFLLNTLKHNLSDRQNFAFDSTFYVENLICFSPNGVGLDEGFYQLLLEFFRTEADARGLSGEELVTQIETYFRRNLADNISLQGLSDELGLSKVYLCRVFKKQRNTTPIDFFTHLKIDRARELIEQYPAISLREISEALGFNDIYYFSKVFKRIIGVPPSEFRAEKQ